MTLSHEENPWIMLIPQINKTEFQLTYAGLSLNPRPLIFMLAHATLSSTYGEVDLILIHMNLELNTYLNN